MHRSGSNPTVRDNRLDSIGILIYRRLIVECLHVASLPSLESVVLADSLPIKNIYIYILAIPMLLLVFILVKS